MDTTPDWTKAGQWVQEEMRRRAWLNADVVTLTGLSNHTLRRILIGEQVRSKSLGKVLAALGYSHDSYERVANGLEPTLLEPADVPDVEQMRSELADLRREFERLRRLVERGQ